MTPLLERFLLLIVGLPKMRPGDQERQAAMRTDLMERLQNHPPGPGEMTLEEATARLEKAPPFRWLGLAAAPVVLAPLTVLLIAAYVEFPDHYLVRGPRSWMPEFLAKRVEERQASLVTRPLTEPVKSETLAEFPRVPRIPASEPDLDSPETLQTEISKSIYSRNGPSPKLIAASQKADPDNAWLKLRQATAAAGKAVKYDYSRRGEIIVDATAARQAMDLCEQASRMPQYVDYSRRKLFRQISCFRRPGTVNEIEALWRLLPSASYDPRFSSLSSLFGARIKELANAGDTAGLTDLVTLYRRIAILEAVQPGASGADLISVGLGLSKPAMAVLRSSGATAAFAEAEDFEIRCRSAANSFRSSWTAIDPDTQAAKGLKAGIYPVVPATDLSYHARLNTGLATKGRGFAFYTSSCSLLLVLIFTIPFVWSATRGAGVASTVKNLARLYDRQSWLRVLAIGFVLPLLSWWLIMWHTRLGCMDLPLDIFDWDWARNLPWLGQMLSAPLSVWITSQQCARVEQARRFAFLGLKPGLLRTGWGVATVTFLVPALYGLVRFFQPGATAASYLCVVVGLQGGLVLWLLWRLLSVFFSPRAAAPGAFLSAWLVTPVLSLVSIVAGLAIFLSQASERKWTPLMPSAIQLDSLTSTEELSRSYSSALRTEFAGDLK